MSRASAEKSICEVLNARVEKLRRHFARVQEPGQRDAVHDARVATRRLRAGIELLGPLLSERPCRAFLKVLRRVRRGLGPLRDVDVMLVHLDEMPNRHAYQRAKYWLVGRLKKERARLHHRCLRKAPADEVLAGLGQWWGLEPEVKECEAAAKSLARTLVPGQLQSFVSRANALAGSRCSEPKSADTSSAEDVHALRIAGKHLRYTLELAEPLGYECPRTLLKEFKKLQDALGMWHDLVVLENQMIEAAVDQELALHDPALHGQVLKLAQSCWDRSERYLDRFAKLWSAGGDKIRRQVLDVFNAESGPMMRIVPQETDASGDDLIPAGPVSEAS